MKYFVIFKKRKTEFSIDGLKFVEQEKPLCIVEKEEIAKDFCSNYNDYYYEAKETEEEQWVKNLRCLITK